MSAETIGVGVMAGALLLDIAEVSVRYLRQDAPMKAGGSTDSTDRAGRGKRALLVAPVVLLFVAAVVAFVRDWNRPLVAIAIFALIWIARRLLIASWPGER